MKALFYFVGENLDVFSENDLDYRIYGEYHPATRVSASKQVHSTIPFQQVNGMWYEHQERVKVRKNITLLRQYTHELFPHNGDQRLVFLFVAFELHSGFRELAPLLQTTVEALDLVKQVHNQVYTNSNPISNLSQYLQNGSSHFLPENQLETVSMTGTFVYHTFIHKHTNHFSLAKKLAACVLSAGEVEVLDNSYSEKWALGLLFHHTLPDITRIMQSDLGSSPPGSNRKIIVDVEHALAAKCVLGESGHVFEKMKRACNVATQNGVLFPKRSDVVKRESTKNIGAIPHIMTKGGGRYNTIEEIFERYLMSQTYVVKAGDFYFTNPDENNEIQSLSIFQNDAAEMCFERNCLGAVLMFVPFCELGDNSTHHFQDPKLLIDVAIMDCKEEITVVQYMLKDVFKNYNPEKRYDSICGCNQYDKSEGLFPQKLERAKN